MKELILIDDNNCQEIIWNYIDTEKATIKAITDYPLMKKLENILKDKKNPDLKQSDHFKIKKVFEYLNWFEPPWYHLDDENRMILKEFYMNGNLKSGAGIRLQFSCNYSERQLHRIRGNALHELSLYLFGK